jgi:hypothetical protein
MVYILDSLMNLKDSDGKVTLIDFLKIFSDGFNNATGNFNKLEPTVDDDEIKFTDEVPLPDKDSILKGLTNDKGEVVVTSTEQAFFTLFGYFPYTAADGESKAKAGMVRDINLTTTVSPNLAAMITIGAQANGYVTGEDATSLSSINIGLIDRVKPVIQDAGKKPIDKEEVIPPNVKYASEIQAFNAFLRKIGSVNGATPGWDQEAIDNFVNTNNAFAEYDQYAATATARLTNPKASSGTIGFLPFNLSLTIDGLSGMKVYQKYIIDGDFLPSSYPSTLEFLIRGITHEIRDNQWITTLDSIAVPKNPFSVPDAQGQTYNGSPQTTSSGRAVGAVAGTGQPTRGDDFVAGSDGCSTKYPELKFTNPRPAATNLSYTDAITYLRKKYGDAIAKAVFAVMFAEASPKDKSKTDYFTSAGGFNYAGVQTDNKKWPTKLIIGQYCRVDSGGVRRAFAIFANDEAFLDFMANRVKSKGLSGTTANTWARTYLNSWVYLNLEKQDINKFNTLVPQKEAIYNSALKRYDKYTA